MKRLILILFANITVINFAFSQCQPYIKIDGNQVLANQTVPAGIVLPFWLKAGQYLAIDQMVNSISVIEFTINGTALEFSQVLSVTTVQTVQPGKVWKIESISKQPSFGTSSGIVMTSAGSRTFTVPPCANYICIEVWGGGGGGGYSSSSSGGSGGGGGGGGYAQQCFPVSPSASLSITIGGGGTAGTSGASAGTGGTSSVTGTGVAISANGGVGGANVASGSGGGAGGTASGNVNIAGGAGANGVASGNPTTGGVGGAAANGGSGGAGGYGSGNATGYPGVIPGGGGGGGGYYNSGYSGGAGAAGQAKITW